MADIRLTREHDIDWFNIALTTDNAESVAQKIKIALRTYFGEWFANTTIGVPYFQEILKKGVSKEYVDTIFIDIIRSVDGVLRITQYVSEITVDGLYRAAFTAETSDNQIFNFNIREIELL